MCGIIAGYNKNNNLIPTILKGLTAVEYRGYDSAGIGFIQNNKIALQKSTGKVFSLKQKITNEASNIAIAHTRWATHGAINKKNAHPHISNSKVAIVHNGIIENHHLIKQNLKQQGYIFNSQTDSEAIAHLIDYQYKQTNNFEQAFTNAIREITGNFAVIAINLDQPEKLYAACNNNPLILTVENDALWLASDAIALSHIKLDCLIIPNNSIIITNQDNYKIFNYQTNQTITQLVSLQSAESCQSKDHYDHFMLKEIHEQPANWQNLITQQINNDNKQLPKKPKNVHIVGCGSSFHSALTAQYWLESIAHCPTKVYIASEYNLHTIAVPEDCILILPSQSGETADTLIALKKAKKLNYKSIITLCNVKHSSLAQQTDQLLHLNCGPEIGVASTKAFTAQLWLFYALANFWGPNKPVDISSLHTAATDALNLKPQLEKLGQILAKHTNIIFIGHGLGYPTSLEAALKLKEISYIHSHAYPAGELKHGPLALVDENLPVIASIMTQENLKKNLNYLEEVQARSGKLIIFHQGQQDIVNDFSKQILIELPKCDPQIAPMLFSIAYQLTAYYTAKALSREIDQPRNLAKSVTVE